MLRSTQGCALLLLFLCFCAHADEAPTHDPAILQQLVAEHGKHTSASGTLTMAKRRIDDLAAEPRIQKVAFWLVFPDRYHLLFTKPGDVDTKTRFVSDGKTRWDINQLFADEEPDMVAKPIGDNRGIEFQLLACFRFDQAALERDFTLVATTQKNGTKLVTLTPKQAPLVEQLSELRLIFSPQLELKSVSSDDPQGNRFDFTLDTLVLDQPIDPGYFTPAK